MRMTSLVLPLLALAALLTPVRAQQPRRFRRPNEPARRAAGRGQASSGLSFGFFG